MVRKEHAAEVRLADLEGKTLLSIWPTPFGLSSGLSRWLVSKGVPVPQVDPVTSEFLAETLEHLVEVDRDLVTLEQEPGDHDAVARVFRALHTLKGTSG